MKAMNEWIRSEQRTWSQSVSRSVSRSVGRSVGQSGDLSVYKAVEYFILAELNLLHVASSERFRKRLTVQSVDGRSSEGEEEGDVKRGGVNWRSTR